MINALLLTIALWLPFMQSPSPVQVEMTRIADIELYDFQVKARNDVQEVNLCFVYNTNLAYQPLRLQDMYAEQHIWIGGSVQVPRMHVIEIVTQNDTRTIFPLADVCVGECGWRKD